jgi:acyl-CoA reductase-like NAD-dependent aldehyde dehydrogenase
MAVAQNELFGPVLSVISFSDDEEAVAIGNSTRFGLVGAAFGGFRESSLGREQGLVGVREYTETTVVSRPTADVSRRLDRRRSA